MKFFIQFFTTVFILFIIWIGVVFFQTQNATKSSQWVYDAYGKKTKIANNIKEKKIIIVAGSNALFGIDSKKLSKTFKIPVVNFGVNAGVLLPYTLYKAKKVIKEGDIVLMPLEYPMYVYDGVPNEQMIDFIFSRDFDMFWNLTFKEQFYMVWNVTLNRIYRGLKAEGGKVVREGLFGVHHIDKNGDQTKTKKKYQNKWMKDQIYNNFAKNPESYGARYNEDSLSWSYIEKFTSWCNENNVKMIFMPSTLLKHKKYFKDKKESWFYKNLKSIIEEKGLNYVGNPYDYMYHKKYYFDSNFHLTKKGRKKRTNKMIKDLKKSTILKSLTP
ncbi:MAG: hypothetical protein U9N59_13385 [Campylobacterota bacterium]|nr:hypothetical protein [Campylobacterota bacterium]